MAGDSPWKGELFEQPSHALFILLNVWIKLRVGSLQIGVRHHTWPAVSGAANVDHVQVILVNQPVEVNIYEIESGSRSKMPQQTGLDVFEFKRLAQQRIGVEVNLSDRKIIRRSPVGVHFAQFFRGQRLGKNGDLGGV